MYHYVGCGLPYVWLVNGYTEQDTPYGKAVAIEDIDGLHRAIGLEIVRRPGRLTGEEVRFLRKEMDMSQRILANCLDTSEITVRKWEQKGVKGPAQRLLRFLYLEVMDENSKLRPLIERLNQLDNSLRVTELHFKDTQQGWQRDRAA